MKWFTAIVGGFIVWGGAMTAVLLIPAAVVPQLYDSVSFVIGLWVVAVPLGIYAGYYSFRSTLKNFDEAETRPPPKTPFRF